MPPIFQDFIERRFFYTKESDGVYRHESLNGNPYEKTLTPFKEIPYVGYPNPNGY